MTDSNSTPTTQAPVDDKNPLDVLEDILKEAKAKGGKGDDQPTGPTPEELAAQKETEDLAAATQVMAQKKAEDQIQIVEQIKELQTISDTPEYKAKVGQEEGEKATKDAQDAASEGYQINQVGHSKV